MWTELGQPSQEESLELLEKRPKAQILGKGEFYEQRRKQAPRAPQADVRTREAGGPEVGGQRLTEWRGGRQDTGAETMEGSSQKQITATQALGRCQLPLGP